jgi:hypothetical protein
MTVLITLTTAGSDTGPFNLFSDVGGFTSAFETGVTKASLLAGYASALVPNGTTIIRVMSDGDCVNYIDIPIVLTTTSSTTVAPNPATSVLTFSKYEKGVFEFTLSNPIPSTSVIISVAQVYGGYSDDCQEDLSDNITSSNALIIPAGGSSGTQTGITPFTCTVASYHKVNYIEVDGWGPCVNGDVIPIDGVSVTIVIDELTCVNPYVCSLYTEWEAPYGSSSLICNDPGLTVYTVFGQTITTGNVVYADSALTTPLSGGTAIVDPSTYTLYLIDSVTGLVGTMIGPCF